MGTATTPSTILYNHSTHWHHHYLQEESHQQCLTLRALLRLSERDARPLLPP
ncbi:hypothetical protein M406DRAFT_56228 [Cryphonectria parasitica EP155]|uniref:Uncharacterized protein n=1 Tax=Cryphonectria parasitica (strain ATCC 38755 / EP155) TaxID=660469 RepID=A0A9P4Y8I2_CRYP1|nr:uncharacterized protein M406DRAFT_56228 [Cryphonectria parasitica EP155]KAF3768733.1 hypothetical protein M406DRAFT_56228 [Cryphonectria parasitica EP155]